MAVDQRLPVTGTDDSDAPVTRQQQKLLDANWHITTERPDRADFLHTVMCQVGLPRKRVEGRTFERRNGHLSILLEAGKLYDGTGWREQPLPYGTAPRLVMVHVSTEAVRTKSRTVEVGESTRQFLQRLGLAPTGGPRGGYTTFRKQMEALAACRLSLGMRKDGRVVTVDAKPIRRFDAWLQHDGAQQSMWPGSLELTEEFYRTLSEHAVPLDHRALAALKHSALALDVYTWLAHRLCRVDREAGVRLSWTNLKDQFGQEYVHARDFKKKFRAALHQVLAVYPAARLSAVPGGLVLLPSHPPLSPTMVALTAPKS